MGVTMLPGDDAVGLHHAAGRNMPIAIRALSQVLPRAATWSRFSAESCSRTTELAELWPECVPRAHEFFAVGVLALSTRRFVRRLA